MMEISLPPEMNRFIEQKVEEGLFASEGEVVTAALQWFKTKDQLVSSMTGIPSQTSQGKTLEQDVGDIEALAFLVMMEAAKDAADDLKMIMEKVKATNAAKRILREMITKVERDISTNLGQTDRIPPLDLSRGMGSRRAYHKAPMPYPDTASAGGVKLIPLDLYEGKIDDIAQLETIRDNLQDRLYSMNELGEMQSLRLQMTMDRRSKIMSTLSNILKKMSDTQDTLVQNIK